MEWNLASVILSGLCLAFAVLLFSTSKKKASLVSSRLPPGPPGWPLIGNMLDLGALPHRSLATLSRIYGPVVWLELGSVNTMVISSADAAMEMFKNHDLSFAGRTTNEAVKVLSYDQGSLVFSQHGPYWRMLRRICITQLFTTSRINSTENLRQKCIDNMIKSMWNEAQGKGSVEIEHFVSRMMFNTIGNLMLSKDLVDPQSKGDAEFFTSLNRAFVWTAKPNVADFFPFLSWLDPQCVKKRMKRDMGHVLDVASSFVKERIQDRNKNDRTSIKNDFLDVLLDYRGNEKDGEPARISEEKINIMILELLATATDTTTVTTEWAMTELLHNPRIMKKLQAELDQVVGQNKKVEEADIGKLQYLQAVVKETLRLHPPAPLLIPRRAVEDSQFLGYSLPKDTQVFVNVWAIGRDPSSWDHPLTFKPERFMNCDTDYKGNHFQFLPFGAGRRVCVGISLAQRMLHLTLGSLVHSFEWALEDGITPENMDMTERFGITLRKAEPLKLVPKLRLVPEILETVV